MGASLAAVGEGFAASLGHVLWVIEAWVGIIVTVCAAVFVVLCLVATRGQQEHAATQPNPVLDAYERDECPWCDTRECIDKTLCNCAAPCGSWLCEAKEASRD